VYTTYYIHQYTHTHAVTMTDMAMAESTLLFDHAQRESSAPILALCVDKSTGIYTYTHTHTHIHILIYTHIYTLHTYTYSYTHIYTYTHTYTHTHTHIHTHIHIHRQYRNARCERDAIVELEEDD
jgi:hypothetical protein